MTNSNYKFIIPRPDKHGGPISFETYDDLEKAFASKSLYPLDLKLGAAKALNDLLEPIRKDFATDPELIKLTNEAYPPPKPKIAAEISKLDIRVGKVLTVDNHPEKDGLYIESIDLGEPEPRTIVSGLSKYISKQDFIGKFVLVVCNMKPSKFAGVLSQGMVLAASNSEKTLVELLDPPSDVKPGDRVKFEGFGSDEPLAVLNPKHKIFEKCAVDFSISSDLVALYKDVEFQVNGSPVTVKTLSGGIIS